MRCSACRISRATGAVCQVLQGHPHRGACLIELVKGFLQGFHQAVPFPVEDFLAATGFLAVVFLGFAAASATRFFAGTAAGSSYESAALANAGCTTLPASVSMVALTSSSSALMASCFVSLSIRVSRKAKRFFA